MENLVGISEEISVEASNGGRDMVVLYTHCFDFDTHSIDLHCYFSLLPKRYIPPPTVNNMHM